MPLVQIRRDHRFVDDATIVKICEALSHVAAAVLSSPEGGSLRSEDIVIEIDDIDYLDINVKQLNVRVWAHDYPSRRGDKLTTLDATRKMMARAVCEQLPPHVTWYVWVLLAPTSYGSDTVDS